MMSVWPESNDHAANARHDVGVAETKAARISWFGGFSLLKQKPAEICTYQPSVLTVHQTEPSKLAPQALPLPLQRFPQD
jgi:hypothetical protein